MGCKCCSQNCTCKDQSCGQGCQCAKECKCPCVTGSKDECCKNCCK
uniref:Metallothionein n=1 Tax=Chironomus riparius TaxID=315576 RepID=F2WW09_9DIPT|nr:metallothionein [Chironomus riparius]